MNRFKVYSDADLLLAIKIHNNGAFMEIYERYWEKLFAIAIHHLHIVQDAEDVVHDVLASLWRNREHDIDNLEHYLAAATKYVVLAGIRKKSRLPVTELYNANDTYFSIEKSIADRQVIELIKKEVNKLPEQCRLIFKMSREEGLMHDEIAISLNISKKTVKNQINKALKRLKKVTGKSTSVLLLFYL